MKNTIAYNKNCSHRLRRKWKLLSLMEVLKLEEETEISKETHGISNRVPPLPVVVVVEKT